MTHLSDYSYVDRGIGVLIFFFWAMNHVYTVDRFYCFHPTKLRKRDPKTLCTVLIFASMIFLIIYDILGMYIKYSMGFWYDASKEQCVTTPKTRYPAAFIPVLITTDFFFNLAWGTKGSAMFLIQLTWHHVSKQYAAKTDFLSSREIQVFKLVSVISIVMYPLLQFAFVPGTLLSTITPQFVSNAQLLVASVLSWYTSKRFSKLKEGLPVNSRGSQKLTHYIQKNRLLGVYLFMEGFFLFVINLDYFTTKYTMHSKFLLDLLTRILNFGFVMVYPTALELLFPLDVIRGEGGTMIYTKAQNESMLGGKTNDDQSTKLEGNNIRSIKVRMMPEIVE
ncbi:hypothetical protein ROZALSC1DRAFT_24978 [Rozella allomycis CSF55]|uniref:Uncharacterized protein n=1 Tax=Rozella allomycis (strain CSF55) TaxID=988480 RepID=A0A4P9YDK8_ROZAC|nr:hypothetical protein ROZALSC1DRAFT_24978 [Rozella allomycis CSF55]